MGKIKVGLYDAAEQPFMGSMISEKAALGMVEAQANLQRLGGESLLTLKHLEAGTGFVSPGIIDVTSVSALPDEEYFGPLLQLIRYDDFDAAIDHGNATRYGSLGPSAGGQGGGLAPLLQADPRRYRQLEQAHYRCIQCSAVWWHRRFRQPQGERLLRC